MRLHVIFEGGPAHGGLHTIDVGIFEKDSPPTDITLAKLEDYVDQDHPDKMDVAVYRLVGELQDSPIPRQFMATYRYTGDYNDLPVTLVTALI